MTHRIRSHAPDIGNFPGGWGIQFPVVVLFHPLNLSRGHQDTGPVSLSGARFRGKRHRVRRWEYLDPILLSVAGDEFKVYAPPLFRRDAVARNDLLAIRLTNDPGAGHISTCICICIVRRGIWVELHIDAELMGTGHQVRHSLNQDARGNRASGGWLGARILDSPLEFRFVRDAGLVAKSIGDGSFRKSGQIHPRFRCAGIQLVRPLRSHADRRHAQTTSVGARLPPGLFSRECFSAAVHEPPVRVIVELVAVALVELG